MKNGIHAKKMIVGLSISILYGCLVLAQCKRYCKVRFSVFGHKK